MMISPSDHLPKHSKISMRLSLFVKISIAIVCASAIKISLGNRRFNHSLKTKKAIAFYPWAIQKRRSPF
jgi:hypothetical protein